MFFSSSLPRERRDVRKKTHPWKKQDRPEVWEGGRESGKEESPGSWRACFGQARLRGADVGSQGPSPGCHFLKLLEKARHVNHRLFEHGSKSALAISPSPSSSPSLAHSLSPSSWGDEARFLQPRGASQQGKTMASTTLLRFTCLIRLLGSDSRTKQSCQPSRLFCVAPGKEGGAVLLVHGGPRAHDV